MVFSLVGAFLIGLVSWKLTELLLPSISSFLQEPLQEFISNVLNGVIDGEFCDILELENVILNSKYSLFIIIKKLSRTTYFHYFYGEVKSLYNRK